jgi:uncharacterized protein with ACT and thioredoxin-like domain
MKQKFLKEDHIMIKYLAKPFNVAFRTENSLDKKIESIKDQIEFEKYKLNKNSIENFVFTKEENEERITKLEKELEYYQEIIRLKDDDSLNKNSIENFVFIIVFGACVISAVIRSGISKLRK